VEFFFSAVWLLSFWEELQPRFSSFSFKVRLDGALSNLV